MNTRSNDCGEDILDLVKWQVEFGPRFPGSPEHRLFTEALTQHLLESLNDVYTQKFHIRLAGRTVACSNLIGVLRASGKATLGPLLLGTHFDTRPIADNEEDELLRQRPIPGANDGGSGTAVLLHLLPYLSSLNITRDIHVVLFDAEDVGNIDGNQFSMGARYLAGHPLPEVPQEVIVLDMIGGAGMVPDLDLHSCRHWGSRRLTKAVFELADRHELPPFVRRKKNRYKYIISDHIPFLLRDISSCLLIDLDYPEWHTHGDLPAALSPESLASIYLLLQTICANASSYLSGLSRL